MFEFACLLDIEKHVYLEINDSNRIIQRKYMHTVLNVLLRLDNMKIMTVTTNFIVLFFAKRKCTWKNELVSYYF